mgnify:CR=1 FL=1
MRKNLCIVLIILICFATTHTYAEETENQTTNTTTDLQTQRSELQNQLDEANGQLNDVQSNLSENLQQVEKLDNKIETSEQTLAEQESKITELKNNIQNVETELNSVTEKYDKQVELFKKRMVAIYMAGDTQYLDVLLKSSSLSDFISSYYLISQLTEIDENLINDLETKKKTIDLSKTKLENEKKEFSSYESVGSESAGGAAQEKDIKTRRKNPVRTGDDSEPLVLLILLLGSGAITLCIRCFKGGNES